MPIYMGFFNKPVVLDRRLHGDVKAKGYEGWIELTGMMYGSHSRSGLDVTVVKFVDRASALLAREINGGVPKLVVIAFVGDDGTAFVTHILRDTVIMRQGLGGSKWVGHVEKPLEALTLNCSTASTNMKDKAPDMPRWSLRQTKPPV